MNEEKNIWGPDKEKFFEELSAAYRNDGQSAYLRDSVAKTVADSEFGEFEKIRKKNKSKNKIFTALLALLVSAGLIYGGFKLAEPADEYKTGLNGEPVAMKKAPEAPVLGDVVEQGENIDAADVDDETNMGAGETTDLTEEKPEAEGASQDGRATDIEEEKTLPQPAPQNMEVAENQPEIEKRSISYKKVSSILEIGPNEPEKLKPALFTMAESLGLKPVNVINDNYVIFVKTEETQGYSEKTEAPVLFFIEFKVAKDNPEKLEIALNYTHDGEDADGNILSRKNMDKIFYLELKRELINLIRRN